MIAIPPTRPITLILSLVNVKNENPNNPRPNNMTNGSSTIVWPEAILTPELKPCLLP